MTAALLAIMWTAFVVLVLIPLATVVSVRLLAWRRIGSREGSASAYLLIVLPTVAPVLWFVSETLHESEAFLLGAVSPAALCFDLLIASAVLLGLLAVLGAHAGAREQQRAGTPHAPTTARLRRLCASNSALATWSMRVFGVADAEHDSATRGLFRPVVEVDSQFAKGLTDAALLGVLLHEVEHAEAFDPLRNLVAHVCLSVNPLRSWLAPEWHRWRAGRELSCDTAAVSAEADPLALAEALILAARPRGSAVVSAPLTGERTTLLNLRIQRLLAPAADHREPAWVVVLPCALLLLELVLPHVLSSAPIQQIHQLAFHPLLTALI